MSDSLELAAQLDSLRADLTTLRQLVYMQQAEIRALRSQAFMALSQLQGDDPRINMEMQRYAIMGFYDQVISELEAIHGPAFAAAVDLRPSMSPEAQEEWYTSLHNIPPPPPPKKS